ncbi:Chch142-like protein [Clanis bilineata nucleopolyhedrovirus]|uniref:Chch142-like protein n=1 Tax=Clanis bilineata nucleopolyhedrovirus TaxID=1307957 RepID=Q0N3X7_9ABAC|nr:Chch142-like protein [Clanis bilineata nucleopolyhedrovirus]ABF47466.1 Chch142-like protein [Clanis bilineata nucleopolyhedrovirus]
MWWVVTVNCGDAAFINAHRRFHAALSYSNCNSNIMSTLRNKSLIKSMQQQTEPEFHTVSVENLKKITRAVLLLKQSNLRLNKMLKHMSMEYEEKYKAKIQRLRADIAKKNRKITRLRNKIQQFICIMRHQNEFVFRTKPPTGNEIDESPGMVIIYKPSIDPKVDKSVCLSVAKAKYKNFMLVNNMNTIMFQRTHEADCFELDIRQMFSC